MKNYSRLAVLLALFVVLCGCVDRGGDGAVDLTTTKTSKGVGTTTTTTTTTTFAPGRVTSTTTPQDLLECIKPPEAGCECVKWVCEGQSTTMASTTTVPCVIVPDLDYVPKVRHFDLVIKGDRFRPGNINAMVGDTVVVNVTSEQGLHNIRETSTNRTVLIRPGESYEFTFQADEEGVYVLTCNPFCDEPLEATITLDEPYIEVC